MSVIEICAIVLAVTYTLNTILMIWRTIQLRDLENHKRDYDTNTQTLRLNWLAAAKECDLLRAKLGEATNG